MFEKEKGEIMTESQSLSEEDVRSLVQGRPPKSTDVLRRLTVGMDTQTDFLRDKYLKDYIPKGGSKIKFVTGRSGSGKTHFSAVMRQEAEELGYLTVSFSAKDVWLHDFREIYLEVLRQCDPERVLRRCANRIISEMGYQPDQIPEGGNLIDHLSEKGESDALSKGEIRSYLREFFTRNPRLDNNFAGACSLLTGGILGHPLLEESNYELLMAYLLGDKTVKLSQIRALGLSPLRITRYNARNLLRSLSEVVRIAGYQGLFIVIDDLEKLLDRSTDAAIRYTKLRRDDAYESIRALIDDIDSMRHVIFFLCFDRELTDDENYGVKSYQALWLRIQNEVVSTRLNRFADIIDMDRLADEVYDAGVQKEMAERLATVLEAAGVETHPLDADFQRDLMERAKYGGLGIPYMLNRLVVEGGRRDV